MPAVSFAAPKSRASKERQPQLAPVRRRRVLIVSPHFPPINAPDHHRVRLALPHLLALGWEAEILAVSPEAVEGLPDPDLANSLPPETKIHWAHAWPYRWTRLAGCGGLAWRARGGLRALGDQLLASGRFHLVFFSTTQFGILPLGPRWLREFGVPYVLDFQDEWISAYYRNHPALTPPGGRLKFALNQWQARRQESRVLLEAAAIISVSSLYFPGMVERQPGLNPRKLHTLPFGGTRDDFTLIDKRRIQQRIFDPHDRRQHWVYVGRGGDDLKLAARAFFGALRQALELGILDRRGLRLHFIGTSYTPAPKARPTFILLAQESGLEDIVEEHTARLPYFQALKVLRDAHAILLFGSDDEGYAPSKIAPCLLAGRPLLAILRKNSEGSQLLSASTSRLLVSFRVDESPEEISRRIIAGWFQNQAYLVTPPSELVALSAGEMACQLGRIFDAAAETK